MKNRFPLGPRTFHARKSTASSFPSAAAVALVDERYVLWLATQAGLESAARLHRIALPAVMTTLLRAVGSEAPLLRTLLFTDQPITELDDDVVLRPVPTHASDGGLALVRALGAEMVLLAQHQPGCLLLVASDDERLIPYLDEAQWRGARVVLVADDAVHDFARLTRDDPSWARLLQQADRRVVLSATALQTLTQAAAGEREAESARSEPPAEPDAQWRAEVARIIGDWWAAEPEQERLDLAAAMRQQQGVPPEADRRILMQVRRELGRNLSFPEKRVMREMVRATVLGEGAPSAQVAAPESALAPA
ncbi:hypothetical protein Talka_00783 [Tepidimonas alkaliphilus]|uniref:NYN domain protein n=1 Tax=Tepidimonas alkaliphilus TaxID=2588942 RepID=A0A554WA29_9BURK|nr:hypothetical protein [Tepidimonas alkaliphilus]TSE20437.1 hypothetical protein Talka_00783 [Tepidimonas alkaliphilus]